MLSLPTAIQRQDVVGPHRHEEIQQRAMLEELARESGHKPEKQRAFAIDDPGIEMGNRHRRRAVRRHAVDLGGVPLGDRGLSQRSQMPLTGNPAKPWPSGIPDSCSKGSAPPPAPRKTNLVG